MAVNRSQSRGSRDVTLNPRFRGYRMHTTFQPWFRQLRLCLKPSGQSPGPSPSPLPAKRRGEGARTDLTSRPPTGWHFRRILQNCGSPSPLPRLFAGRGRVRGVGDLPQRPASSNRSSRRDVRCVHPIAAFAGMTRALRVQRPAAAARLRCDLSGRPAPECGCGSALSSFRCRAAERRRRVARARP